ncbi:MAG: lysophospholipid acyltransferase family protein [Acidimicrobiia bacterium]|nr:lysophospholipid acyltransferase family protein [Acidimicrobiia bacterium]
MTEAPSGLAGSLAEAEWKNWGEGVEHPSGYLRGSLTVLGIFIVLILLVLLAPVLAPAALVVDVIRRKNWATLRFYGFAVAVLFAYSKALTAAFVKFFTAGFGPGRRPRRKRHMVHLQDTWGNSMLDAARRFYGVSWSVKGQDLLAPGPVIMLARHASILDTLLPVDLAHRPETGMRLNYVMKGELIADPTIFFASQVIPNVFVDRSGTDTASELKKVATLATNVGPRDVIVVYPEGTRFTPHKQERLRKKFADDGNVEALTRAEALQHVLPIRPGGPQTLIGELPDADVLIVAHTGLEDTASASDFLNGRFIGAHVQVECWRVPRADIPADPTEQRLWLESQWAKVDEWVGEHRARHTRK